MLTASDEEIVAAFKLWDKDNADGKCFTPEEASAHPADVQATNRANAFIGYIRQVQLETDK